MDGRRVSAIGLLLSTATENFSFGDNSSTYSKFFHCHHQALLSPGVETLFLAASSA
jgi:hypothetical protein